MTEHKLARLSFNSSGWEHPTGEAAKLEGHGSYNRDQGFGHEDWLFRFSWSIDGWKYGYLQPVSRARERMIRQVLDVTLYTLRPKKERQYIANIYSAEVLTDEQAKLALAAFHDHGWLGIMKAEVAAVQGNSAILDRPTKPHHILNIRFRRDDVDFFSSDIIAMDNDPLVKYQRYQLYPLKSGHRVKIETTARKHKQKGKPTIDAPSTVFRKGSAASEYTPEHQVMQRRLMADLKGEYGDDSVIAEQDYIDIKVETENEVRLYELKTDPTARSTIRHALGQILEYAYHRDKPFGKPIRLVIVGRKELEASDQFYLRRLADDFGLPLEYRVVPLESRKT